MTAELRANRCHFPGMVELSLSSPGATLATASSSVIRLSGTATQRPCRGGCFEINRFHQHCGSWMSWLEVRASREAPTDLALLAAVLSGIGEVARSPGFGFAPVGLGRSDCDEQTTFVSPARQIRVKVASYSLATRVSMAS